MKPYKNRESEYAEARILRRLGWGYRTISNSIGINWMTVRNWTRDIPTDITTTIDIAKQSREVPFDKLTKKDSRRKRLLSERGSECEQCGIDEWMNQKIPLEMHHIDGDIQNNVKENLILLCPNCHSQTPSWRNSRRASLRN